MCLRDKRTLRQRLQDKWRYCKGAHFGFQLLKTYIKALTSTKDFAETVTSEGFDTMHAVPNFEVAKSVAFFFKKKKN